MLLQHLAKMLRVHVVTADTFGTAATQLAGLPVQLVVLGSTRQDEANLEFVSKLGLDSVVAIGNGRNDRKMLQAAALAIIVIQREGAAHAAMLDADVVAPGVVEALELLCQPLRLIATLRA